MRLVHDDRAPRDRVDLRAPALRHLVRRDDHAGKVRARRRFSRRRRVPPRRHCSQPRVFVGGLVLEASDLLEDRSSSRPVLGLAALDGSPHRVDRSVAQLAADPHGLADPPEREGVGAGFEDDEIFRSERGEPPLCLARPRQAHARRDDDEDRALVEVTRGDGERLDRLPDAHLVRDQAPPAPLEPELDALPLERVQRREQISREQIQPIQRRRLGVRTRRRAEGSPEDPGASSVGPTRSRAIPLGAILFSLESDEGGGRDERGRDSRGGAAREVPLVDERFTLERRDDGFVREEGELPARHRALVVLGARHRGGAEERRARGGRSPRRGARGRGGRRRAGGGGVHGVHDVVLAAVLVAEAPRALRRELLARGDVRARVRADVGALGERRVHGVGAVRRAPQHERVRVDHLRPERRGLGHGEAGPRRARAGGVRARTTRGLRRTHGLGRTRGLGRRPNHPGVIARAPGVRRIRRRRRPRASK